MTTHQIFTYFDVNVKLTIESQCRHFKQICGSCGLRGHRPLNTSRCKRDSIEMLGAILDQVTGVDRVLNGIDIPDNNFEEAAKSWLVNQNHFFRLGVFTPPKGKIEILKNKFSVGLKSLSE